MNPRVVRLWMACGGVALRVYRFSRGQPRSPDLINTNLKGYGSKRFHHMQ